MLIQKCNGDIRWCIDFRAINAVTKKDAYPLPLIKQCLDSLVGVVFMSTLDIYELWILATAVGHC